MLPMNKLCNRYNIKGEGVLHKRCSTQKPLKVLNKTPLIEPVFNKDVGLQMFRHLFVMLFHFWMY